MGKPLTIQKGDDDRIEALKSKLGAKSKIDVVRQALSLLESEIAQKERAHRWRTAVREVKRADDSTSSEFRANSRLKRLD